VTVMTETHPIRLYAIYVTVFPRYESEKLHPIYSPT